MEMNLNTDEARSEDQPRRKRGAQPGNLNALKHGSYSRRLREPGAEAYLEQEIVTLRNLVQRASQLAADPDMNLTTLLKVLDTIGSAMNRLANLLQAQKQLDKSSTDVNAVLLQAVIEVARELGIQ
ncbi:MAG: hypothetical protein A2Z16_08950 [Chloroflexi bacterium RBG_16_54_18]|nr:MAG: hypothetical protein A2Z16_08950 [Chloroflexi bacterium RBG_16_54_18]